jgi:hypothetical protein
VPRKTGGREWWVDVEIDGQSRRILVEGPSARVAAATVEWAWREGAVKEYPSQAGPLLIIWRNVTDLNVVNACDAT